MQSLIDDFGANANLADFSGVTPLALSVARGQAKVMEALMKHNQNQALAKVANLLGSEGVVNATFVTPRKEGEKQFDGVNKGPAKPSTTTFNPFSLVDNVGALGKTEKNAEENASGSGPLPISTDPIKKVLENEIEKMAQDLGSKGPSREPNFENPFHASGGNGDLDAMPGSRYFSPAQYPWRQNELRSWSEPRVTHGGRRDPYLPDDSLAQTLRRLADRLHGHTPSPMFAPSAPSPRSPSPAHLPKYTPLHDIRLQPSEISKRGRGTKVLKPAFYMDDMFVDAYSQMRESEAARRVGVTLGVRILVIRKTLGEIDFFLGGWTFNK